MTGRLTSGTFSLSACDDAASVVTALRNDTAQALRPAGTARLDLTTLANILGPAIVLKKPNNDRDRLDAIDELLEEPITNF